MKRSLAFSLAAASCLLAGCCSTHHATKQWEYKVALTPIDPQDRTRPVRIELREQFLNVLGKDGWVLVTADSDLFYLKRPKE
jgi:ABC-type phosphate/phosphonate transport system substrate-binding protein